MLDSETHFRMGLLTERVKLKFQTKYLDDQNYSKFPCGCCCIYQESLHLEKGEGGGGALRNLEDAPKKTFFFWECLPKIEF